MANILRTLMSKNRIRYLEDGFNLDLCYVTDRIIAMGYPAEGGQGLFRNPRSEIVRLLTLKHEGHYRVYNLCGEQTYNPSIFGGEVVHFPLKDQQAPPLTMVASFCDNAEKWLLSHRRNTVVVHCKAGKGRTGMMICALLMHMGICEGPKKALDLFAERRTADGKGITIASQKRYVGYFYRLMASGMRFSSFQSLQLQYIKLTGFSKGSLSRLVVCLYVRDPQTTETILLAEIKSAAATKHAASNVHSISPSGKSSIGLFPRGERYHLLMNNQEFYVIFEIDAAAALRWVVRGDFKIQVFEEVLSKRNSLFFTWFNTSYIDDQHLIIPRHQMDKVMRCLPSKIQMEVSFSDPRSWGPSSSLIGHSNNRLSNRSHSITQTIVPGRTSRQGQRHSVGT
eukprot:g1020.t1